MVSSPGFFYGLSVAGVMYSRFILNSLLPAFDGPSQDSLSVDGVEQRCFSFNVLFTTL